MSSKARDLSDIVSNLSGNAKKGIVVKVNGSELVFGDVGTSGFMVLNMLIPMVMVSRKTYKSLQQIVGDNISVANVTTDLLMKVFLLQI